MKPGRLGAEMLTMLVCDHVYRDSMSNKHSILGVFSAITCKAFPATHGRLYVFVSLTNGHGDAKCALRLALVETETQIFKAEGNIRFANPLQVVEMVFEVKNLTLNCPGKYAFEFYVNDDMIGQRSFYVLDAEERRKL